MRADLKTFEIGGYQFVLELDTGGFPGYPYYLWVYKENSRAVDLYKRLGFNIYEDKGERFLMLYKNKCNNSC